MTTLAQPISSESLYQAVWRWHFVAGLLVLPVLIFLAVTGGLYLFKPELDHFIYRKMEDVVPQTSAFAPPSQIIAQTEGGTGGHVLQFTMPSEPNRAVRLVVRAPSGDALTAFANPYDARFLGATPYGGIMQTVRKLHSLQKFGFWASSVIEIAAGWSIILVGTGVFLWWPRGQSGGVTTIRGTPRTRHFWRDLHAITGSFAAAIILFLAVTGMPWSMFWGDHVQSWATNAGLGQPKAPAEAMPEFLMAEKTPPTPSSDVHAGHHHGGNNDLGLPWALEQAPMPASIDTQHAAVSIDTAFARLEQLGIPHPYSVALPTGPKGAYVASYLPDRAEDGRVVYLDQYSVDVIGEAGFAQYGPVAKAIEWGIAVHQGQEYGPINRYLMLTGCLSIIALAISAITMWWKRRPQGRIGMPAMPVDRRAMRGVLCVVVVTGIIYPLVGLSFVVAMGVRWISIQVAALS